MEWIHELLGYEQIKIIQNDEMFRFSVDSMLLAHFVRTTRDTKNIIDLGCGNAPIPLYLTLKTQAKIIGVEIQEPVAELAKRSVALNHFENQIEIIHADIKDIYKRDFANRFDIVISNPPYFKWKESSKINKNQFLTIARHEVKIKLEEIISEAKKLLVDGGQFYLVHRADRLDEIVLALHLERFQMKRIQFIYPKTNDKEALLVLIEARKNKKSECKVIEPCYIYQENGEYTQQLKKIFHFPKQNIE
ncbi:MAG: tRNA1(Val) (adenine(37)-N6)-methyltransferase [Bacilli bacterium]|nr:tRNA1(Val) (adenine(37)-N6)-methyltransferase [Bacilli bacterium]